MEEKEKFVKELPVIKNLKPEEISKIYDKIIIEKIGKNKFVFEEGNYCSYIYFVCAGRVKMLAHSSAGKDFILRIVSSNDIISDNNLLFERRSECSYSAKALENSIVAKINVSDFSELLNRKPELYKAYAEVIDSHLTEAYIGLKNMAFEKVERRIARHLIQFAKNTGEKTDSGVKLGIKLSRQEIANLTGTTIETAIRVMSKFKKAKVITEKEGFIHILERHKLVNIAEEF
ncbi:MAG: Crp/Fnr family transcriptional regulator [Candidatus Delongbacteria bacterium]|jgi:CRP/FNR family transcriptional regulator|nr:Crp/Fnr family transcriptional regulator [Candidatus Delongbacteria bacterium]MDD4204921.1 Crp/Fnr family transcriptional regulator [Candidatus Delongbacteria bacterium]MDY0017319.1 Crp/Fnr family transcriptional regulator [Candidatus Delongbacteria bacterium]